MTDDATPDEGMGPIDFVLLEFPDQVPDGEIAAEILRLVEAGIIRLYDVLAIAKDDDGSFDAVELSALPGAGGFDTFAGARSGLLDDSDVAEAAALIEPGCIGVLLVYENAWAARFAMATLRHGGQMIASERIPVTTVLEVLDALEAG